MIIRAIAGFTRALAKPKDWDEEKFGKCMGLPILDHVDEQGQRSMISAWEPTPDEVVRLQGGAPLYLRVLGTIHPPVGVWIGDLPLDHPDLLADEVDKVPRLVRVVLDRLLATYDNEINETSREELVKLLLEVRQGRGLR